MTICKKASLEGTTGIARVGPLVVLVASLFGAPAFGAQGEWEGDWFVDERFDTTGELGLAPYPVETFTLTIREFDPIADSWGELAFDNLGFAVTQGIIRDLEFDGTNLTIGIDYSPFLPGYPSESDFFVQVDAVVVGDSMTGDFDEPAPSPVLGLISFRGPFAATLVDVPEPQGLALVLVGCAVLLSYRRAVHLAWRAVGPARASMVKHLQSSDESIG